MDSSKITKILKAISKIIDIAICFFSKKSYSQKSNVEIEQDASTNIDMVKKVNDSIKNKLVASICIMFVFYVCGCINLNFGTESSKTEDKKNVKDSKTVMLANPLNVYRTSTNIVIRALVQNKRGKWVESDKDVLIPSGWYFVSGVGIDEEK